MLHKLRDSDKLSVDPPLAPLWIPSPSKQLLNIRKLCSFDAAQQFTEQNQKTFFFVIMLINLIVLRIFQYIVRVFIQSLSAVSTEMCTTFHIHAPAAGPVMHYE